MKINGNEIRPGFMILHNGDVWVAIKTEHVKPGKGGAYAQVELKNIFTGSKLNERFRSSESVERIRVDEEDYQFLFADGDSLMFMHMQNFEQISVPRGLLGERAALLRESMKVKIDSYETRIVAVHLPDHVVVQITETEPVIKGQTATGSYKPAQVEEGFRVMVPPFINSGERIVITTEDLTYVKRAEAE